MSLIVAHQLPRMIQKGVVATLDLDVYSAASAQQTASAATVTINLGTRTIVDAAAATALGPPATYTLTAATTEDEGLSDQYLEVWSVTIGSTVHTFRRPGYLVRHLFYPTITDTDLTDRDSDLLNIVRSTVTDLSQYREAARKKIERDLLKKGRRPWLIFDNYQLADAHIALSLAYFYRDNAIAIGDGRYDEEEEKRMAEYEKEMAGANFRYDTDETGDITDESMTAATSTLRLTSASRSRFSRRWR